MAEMTSVSHSMKAFLNDKSYWYFFDKRCPQCGEHLQAVKDPVTGEPRSDGACVNCGWHPVSTNNAEAERLNHARKQMTIKSADNFLTYTSIAPDRSIFSHSFKGFVAEPNSPAENVKGKMLAIADRIGQGQVTHSFLHGQTGSGKTHLAVASVFEALKTSNYGLKASVINCPTLIQQLHESIHQSTEDRRTLEHKLNMIKQEGKLLVLDDLGAEAKTELSDFDLREITDLINHFEDRSLLITTNKTGADLQKLYGRRNMSRLIKHTHNGTTNYYVDFTGVPDYRATVA